jgi:LemA protein
MKGLWIGLGTAAVFVLVLALCFGSYIGSKNQIVEKANDIPLQLSNIDVDLQRRADLIPNLVETVKGYAKVEESILTAIANARAGLMTARSPEEKLAANDRLNVALLPLMRLQENYPDLKSNEHFRALEDELAGTENRIAVARRHYNTAIRDYNVFIEQFPNSVWAGIAGYKPRTEYYAADSGSKTAPKVDFNNK